ncbi:MAG: DUF427 domain-containing protein [Gemmobacter sp.]
MPDHIRIYPAQGTWVVRANGAVIGESRAALELTEGDYPPVIYFPRADLAMAMLDPSPTRTTCPWKGQASYHSLVTKSGTLADVGWSYDAPRPGLERIAGMIAFDRSRVTVERL